MASCVDALANSRSLGLPPSRSFRRRVRVRRVAALRAVAATAELHQWILEHGRAFGGVSSGFSRRLLVDDLPEDALPSAAPPLPGRTARSVERHADDLLDENMFLDVQPTGSLALQGVVDIAAEPGPCKADADTFEFEEDGVVEADAALVENEQDAVVAPGSVPSVDCRSLELRLGGLEMTLHRAEEFLSARIQGCAQQSSDAIHALSLAVLAAAAGPRLQVPADPVEVCQTRSRELAGIAFPKDETDDAVKDRRFWQQWCARGDEWRQFLPPRPCRTGRQQVPASCEQAGTSSLDPCVFLPAESEGLHLQVPRVPVEVCQASCRDLGQTASPWDGTRVAAMDLCFWQRWCARGDAWRQFLPPSLCRARSQRVQAPRAPAGG